MQIRFAVGAETVTFECDTALHKQADWLLGVLRDIASERGNSFFAPGRTIQLGWSLLTLVREGGELQVHEPDFDADPFTRTRKNLTVTLTVIAQQNDWLHRLGAEPTAVDYRDKIFVADGALKTDSVFLQRLPRGESEGDSGWAMKLLSDPKRDTTWEWVFVFALIRFRPWYLPFLTLPVGFIVVFRDDQLDAILDSDNKTVYSR